MNNLLQKLFYCLNERHFSAEMYVINPDALFNTTGKQRQFILSCCFIKCVFNLFNEIKQNDYGCDSIREIMIRTSQMFLTSTSLAIPSKWIKSLIRDHIQFGTVTIYMKGLCKNLSTNISINNYKCSLYNKLKKQT